ncbi:BTAD domain-containing putative transcriptional regulator [Actinoplanes sp. NPDC049802]|uniref:AfsR/SARP family transcriptional regulator n=1 Tax=Actinoplanes sp. NPDC049802 TaxID=3154742 RepID=UPI0033CE003C
MQKAFEFRVLGPISATVRGQTIPLTATRQKAALATLLLDAGRVVSVGRLAEAIWGGRLPRNPENQIAICISALRRAFSNAGAGAGLIETHAPGYLVRLDGHFLDIERAKELEAAARKALADEDHELAVDRFREAIGLWRGPVLAGLTSPALGPEVARWEEKRLVLAEECAESELRLGRDHELVSELTAFVAANPLRERPRRQLMLSLYRTGRQADALSLYQDTRKLLDRELGLEPGPEIRALHDAILKGTLRVTATESAPRRPERPGGGSSANDFRANRNGDDTEQDSGKAIRPPPQMLPAGTADFAGRDAETSALSAALTGDSDHGKLEVVAISGPGGIGKTALAITVAHRVGDRFPDGRLYVNLNGAELPPARPMQVLGVFLRELGVDNAILPDSLPQRAAMYRSALASRRILVVLDNAADETQVQHLLPGSGRSAALITSRTRLTGLDGAEHLELGLLPDHDVMTLLARVTGPERIGEDPAAARELVQCCGGLPLAVRIVSARLAARKHQRLSRFARRLTDEGRRLDEMKHGSLEVRASIALSYRSLSRDARRLFRRLALVEAPDFAAWVGAPLMGTSAVTAEDLMETLVDAQLVDVFGRDETGQVRYRLHDLVRLYARERAALEEKPADRNAAIVRMMGTWLALVEQAHERILGGNFAVIHGSGERWGLDRGLCDELIGEPSVWYEAERQSIVAAIHQAADHNLDEHCWDLAVSSISLFGTRSHYDEWRETHETALSAVRGALNMRGEAAVHTGLGDLYVTLHRYEEASEHLRQALAIFSTVNERHGYAVALRKAAYADSVVGNLSQAFAKYEEAKRILHDVGDRGAETHVVRWIGQLHLETGNFDQAEHHLTRAAEMSSDSQRSHAQAQYRLGELALARGETPQAEAVFTEVLRIVTEIRDRRGRGYALHGLGLAKVRQGDLSQAEVLLTEARIEAAEIGDHLIEIPTLLALAEYEQAMSRPEGALRYLREAESLSDRIHASLWLQRCRNRIAELRHLAAHK